MRLLWVADAPRFWPAFRCCASQAELLLVGQVSIARYLFCPPASSAACLRVGWDDTIYQRTGDLII